MVRTEVYPDFWIDPIEFLKVISYWTNDIEMTEVASWPINS